MSTTAWRLVADDAEEAWYELAVYHVREDAEADIATIEAAYPGRPYWVEFRVEELVIADRRTPGELAHALIALADLSEIETTWTDPEASDSWWSEHGAARLVRP